MGKKKRERDVEVERMADLGGWEYFKAIDGASERERWTLALRHEVKASALEYALWWDLKKDPEATGTLDARKGSKEAWAVALRDAATSPEGASPEGASALDDDAREELIVAVLARHDSSFEDYRDRLLFVLAAHDDEADEDDDSDSDDEDEDDDTDSDDDSNDEEDDDDDA